jgi:hypothetical protein
LLKESRIKTDKIFSLSKSRIIMNIGRIDASTFSRVKKDIERLF